MGPKGRSYVQGTYSEESSFFLPVFPGLRQKRSRFANPMTDELRHKILKLIEDRPDFNQRDLASALGISLGKTNYCLKALLEKGWIKAKNFKNSKNKLAYAYILTPSGLEEKIKLTLTYYSIKKREYEELREELEKLGIREDGMSEEPGSV